MLAYKKPMGWRFSLLAMAAALIAGAGAAHSQYFPAPPNWGFGYEHFDQVRFLQARVDKVQARIAQMDYRHQITGRSEHRLQEEANAIQRHLRNDAAYGLTPEQTDAITARVIQLEQQVDAAYEERDRRLREPFDYGNPDWRRDADEDRDGNYRDDRWEDDRRLNTAAGPPR